MIAALFLWLVLALLEGAFLDGAFVLPLPLQPWQVFLDAAVPATLWITALGASYCNSTAWSMEGPLIRSHLLSHLAHPECLAQKLRDDPE